MELLNSRTLYLAERSLPIVVLAVVATYTYAWFFETPYTGFYFETNGEVGSIFYQPPSGAGLKTGDHIIRLGGRLWQEYQSSLLVTPFANVQEGVTVMIVVERNGQTLTIPHVFPGPTTGEIIQRLVNLWPLPYFFWLFGTATLILVRPKDTRWRLLIAFQYLTALWLAAGIPSVWRVMASAVVFRVFIWLSAPVYIHLHWIFPKPLVETRRTLWGALYGLAIGLAIAQAFQWLPRNSYYLGFLIAIAASAILILAHFARRPEHRPALQPILIIGSLSLILPLVLAAYAALTDDSSIAGGGLLFLPLLPGAYFYSAQRQRLGGLELRANRIISLYLYLAFMVVAILALSPLINGLSVRGIEASFLALMMTLLAAVMTLAGYSRFQQFVERRVLGIQPTTDVLSTHASRITASKRMDDLLSLLRDEVAPRVLLRQSALMTLDGPALKLLYAHGLDNLEIPLSPIDLLAVGGKYLPPGAALTGIPQWVRLILPLSIDGQPLAFWLLGQRDPDDFYSQADIRILQTIADQTAVALAHIQQTERLRRLYANDIDQREAERASLARELHDGVLNELGQLKHLVDDVLESDRVNQSYERVSDTLRRTIADLRPAALNYGLGLAIADLVENVADASDESAPIIEIEIDDPMLDAAMDSAAKMYLYRMVQQALVNAVQHARADTISLHGHIRPDSIMLIVQDNGVGFDSGRQMDIERLLAKKHFGLAGMFERAAIIGAEVGFQSRPGSGTTVQISWQPRDPKVRP